MRLWWALMKYWIGDLLDWMFLIDEDDRRHQQRPGIGVVTFSAR